MLQSQLGHQLQTARQAQLPLRLRQAQTGLRRLCRAAGDADQPRRHLRIASQQLLELGIVLIAALQALQRTQHGLQQRRAAIVRTHAFEKAVEVIDRGAARRAGVTRRTRQQLVQALAQVRQIVGFAEIGGRCERQHGAHAGGIGTGTDQHAGQALGRTMATQLAQELPTVKPVQFAIDDQQAGHLALARRQGGMAIGCRLHAHAGT